jgi:hypothetical protein
MVAQFPRIFASEEQEHLYEVVREQDETLEKRKLAEPKAYLENETFVPFTEP